MDFIRKHIYKIVIVLIVLFLFKSCQSCSRKRDLNELRVYTDSVKTAMQDSNKELLDSIEYLNSVIAGKDATISRYELWVDMLNGRVGDLKNQVGDLKADKTELRKDNKNLINKINQ